MAYIVYQVDKKTGVKYAYESVSYWDKEKQQPRSKRRYIGKVDPETGEIIRKKESGTHSDEKAPDPQELSELYAAIKEKDQKIEEMQSELRASQERCEKLTEALKKIRMLTEVDTADVR